MKTLKITPGPWNYLEVATGAFRIYDEIKPEYIAVIAKPKKRTQEEAEANAQLIAEAGTVAIGLL